jgi:hypothetical protein
MTDGIVLLKDMKRNEWIRWEWLLVTEQGDAEQKHVKGRECSIESVASAAKDFDVMRAAFLSIQES